MVKKVLFLSSANSARSQMAEALLRALAGDAFDAQSAGSAVGKLRRRHGLVMSGESRECGYLVDDWTWEARRVRSFGEGWLTCRVSRRRPLQAA